MNKIPVSVLAMLALLLGAGVAIQTVRIKHLGAQAAATVAALEEKSRQLEQLKAAVQHFEEQRRESGRELNDLRHELAAVRSATGPTAPASAPEALPAIDGLTATKENEEAGPFGGMLAKMFDDPEMRKFIRAQQRQMMDSLYEPLIQRLGLTPEEGEVFKDHLADTQMGAASQAGSLFGGSATNRAEAMATLSAEQKRANEALKVFLGEAGYAQYQTYQETLGERMQLNQFRMQAGGKHPMTDVQTEWLLTLMGEEKRAATTASGIAFPGAGQAPADMQAMFSGENAEQLYRMQESVNQRVYERAREGLDPDQLVAFGRFQADQLQTLRMGMNMMRMIITPAPEGDNAAR